MADPGAPLIERAFAKINLALHVRARMADGYHRIETLFAFAEHGDTLVAELSDELRLTLDGPFAAGLPEDGRNLALVAAQMLRDRFAVDRGADIRLIKRLPVASGIGGGSADAAAVLRLLDRLWGLDAPAEQLSAIARELGADIPACLVSQTVLGKDRGEALTPVDGSALAGTPILFVNPGVAIATGPVFAAWDGIDRGPLTLPEPLALDPGWRNDLHPAAQTLAPEIASVLAELKSCKSAIFTQMSGSGATCFALFDAMTSRDEAAERIALSQPDWWLLVSRLR